MSRSLSRPRQARYDRLIAYRQRQMWKILVLPLRSFRGDLTLVIMTAGQPLWLRARNDGSSAPLRQRFHRLGINNNLAKRRNILNLNIVQINSKPFSKRKMWKIIFCLPVVLFLICGKNWNGITETFVITLEGLREFFCTRGKSVYLYLWNRNRCLLLTFILQRKNLWLIEDKINVSLSLYSSHDF